MSRPTEQFRNTEPTQRRPDVAWLREAREQKGLSLDDLARTTKICPKYLKALDAGAADLLPPMFFIRGFVKTYAKEVGLNPDAAADRYLAELLTHTPLTGDENVRALVETAVARTGVIGYEQHHAPLINSLHPERSSRLILAAAAVGAVMYVGPFNWVAWASRVAAPAVSDEPAPPPVAAPAIEAQPATPATDLAAGPMKFELNPKGACWFSATADGNQVKAELLQAGDKRPIEAQEVLVLRVGDPDACAYSINGRAGRSLGSPGSPATVRITKDNVRDFVLQ